MPGTRRIGGARVGWVNATWPFGILSASRDRIVLNATPIGKYEFSPQDVIVIEEYGSLPILGGGVQIRHNERDYPKKIIFWCLGSPGPLGHIPLVTVFLVSVPIWRVEFLGDAIMAPGHSPGEISSFLYLLALITGILSLFFGIEVIGRLPQAPGQAGWPEDEACISAPGGQRLRETATLPSGLAGDPAAGRYGHRGDSQ